VVRAAARSNAFLPVLNNRYGNHATMIYTLQPKMENGQTVVHEEMSGKMP
jgi:hypothetical protein